MLIRPKIASVVYAHNPMSFKDMHFLMSVLRSTSNHTTLTYRCPILSLWEEEPGCVVCIEPSNLALSGKRKKKLSLPEKQVHRVWYVVSCTLFAKGLN